MKRKQLINNSLTSVLQAAASGLLIFLLYKFLLQTIGVTNLGIWSVILSATSVTLVANLGMSDSIVKFVAQYHAQNNTETISRIIQTVCISVAVFYGLILIASCPLMIYSMQFFMAGESLQTAVSVIPYACIAFWLLSLNSVAVSGLVGFHRMSLRNYIMIGDSLLYLGMCYLLAPVYGLSGVAFARVLQNFITLVLSWSVLRVIFPALPLVPVFWGKRYFKEIIGYALNFQAISLLVLLCDPATKLLLAKFGTLSLVGYYEMASKLVTQARSFIVSACQNLVPLFAGLQVTDPAKLEDIRNNAYHLIFLVTLPLYSFLIVGSPLIAKIWIGHPETDFVISAALLSFGWLVNTVAVPSYFAWLGTGKMKWNVYSHLMTAVLNILLGITLGAIYGGYGVITGWMLSLIAGSLYILLKYHNENSLPGRLLLPSDLGRTLGITVSGVAFITAVYLSNLLPKTMLVESGALLVYVVITVTPLLSNKLVRDAVNWVKLRDSNI